MTALYFDAFSTMPLLPEVKTAMCQGLEADVGNPHSHHLHGLIAARSIDRVRSSLAKCYGGHPDNYVLTSGATEANNFALRQGWQWGGRTGVIFSAIEHKCVIESARRAGEDGAQFRSIPVEPNGCVNLNAYAEMLKMGPSLVSIMAANNEIGTINDVEHLCCLAQAVGARFHTDAAQITTHDDFSVDLTGVDFASFSAHKLGGPIGIGALYISPIVSGLRPLTEGGGQQGGLRSGTLSPLLCEGYAAALDVWTERGAVLRKKNSELMGLLQNTLGEFAADERIFGPAFPIRHRANLALKVKGDPELILAQLFGGLSISDGATCSAGSIARSHVLDAIHAPRGEHLLRLSVNPLCTDFDVHSASTLLLNALRRVAELAE